MIMKDYWNELSLKERWGKKERFNHILSYIDEKLSSKDLPSVTVEDPVIIEDEEETVADISVHVTDSENNGLSGATVTVQDTNGEFTCTTGSAGGCTIKDIPVGEYTLETVKEGYLTSEDEFTVIDGENLFEVSLDSATSNMEMGSGLDEGD